MTRREITLLVVLAALIVVPVSFTLLHDSRVTGYTQLTDGRVCAVKRNGRVICPDAKPPATKPHSHKETRA